MKRILFFIIFFVASIVEAQTSSYVQRFATNSGPLKGAYIYLVPQDSTYPAGALQLTEDTGKDGVYYRAAVADGEYKIYIDPDGAGAAGVSLSNRYQHIWIGENRMTRVANQFDNNMKLNPSALDTIYLSTNVALKKGEIATALVGGKIVIMIGIDSSGTIDSIASQRWVRTQSFIKFINGTDTVAYRSWVRAQNFGTGSGDCDGYARYLNPDHFKFSGPNNDTVSIQDSILIRLIGSIDMSNYVTLTGTQEVTGNKDYSGTNDFETGELILPSAGTSPERGQIWLGSYLTWRNRDGDTDTSSTRDYVRDYISQTNLSIQNLLPKTNLVYNLGSASKKWNYIYTDHISGGDVYFEGSTYTFNARTSFNYFVNLQYTAISPGTSSTINVNGGNVVNLLETTANRTVTTITKSNLGDGDIIYICNEGVDYTVTFNETGNLNLAGEVTLGAADTLVLMYDVWLGKWVELSRSDN